MKKIDEYWMVIAEDKIILTWVNLTIRQKKDDTEQKTGEMIVLDIAHPLPLNELPVMVVYRHRLYRARRKRTVERFDNFTKRLSPVTAQRINHLVSKRRRGELKQEECSELFHLFCRRDRI